MKRLTYIVLVFLLIVTGVCVAGCGGNNVLETPADEYSIDYYNKLEWNTIEYASSYEVAIKDENGQIQTITTRMPSVSLDTLEVGNYIIKIKAISKKRGVKESLWSNDIYFQKKKSTGCIYELINGNTEFRIKKYGKAQGEIEIEDTYMGLPLTSISDNAFKGCIKVTKIKLGNRIETIGEKSFYNCTMLEEIELNEDLKSIGKAAFQSCRSLKKISIPKNITTIEESTFSSCAKLEEVNLGNVSYIEESAFSDCVSLKTLNIPDSVYYINNYAFSGNSSLTTINIGSGLNFICEYSFYRCSRLTDVNFNENNALQSIGKCAFESCSELESITFPEGLITVEDMAFYRCSKLKNVSISDTINHLGGFIFHDTYLYNNAVANSQDYIYADKWLVAISEDLVNRILDTEEKVTEENRSLTIFNDSCIRNDTVGIADRVYVAVKGLREVYLPDCIKYLGKYAFAGCTQLWKFEVSGDSKLELIDDFCFQSTGLSNLSLNSKMKNLKRIGSYTFYDSNLPYKTGDWIPNCVNEIGKSAFEQTPLWRQANGIVYADEWIVGINGICPTTVSITRDTDTSTGRIKYKKIAEYAFYEQTGLQNFNGFAYVDRICKGAFYGSGITSVTLNERFTKIEDYTFAECGSLTQINFPQTVEEGEGVKEIGIGAFLNCYGLLRVITGNSLEIVGEDAFKNCLSLAKVDLGNNVKEIGARAFLGCWHLNNLVLPNSIKKIDGYTFKQCMSLTNITMEGVESIGEYAFWGSGIKEFNAPDSLKSIDKYAFLSCEMLEKVNLNKVESVGRYAFYGDYNIKSLNIPSSVKSIGECAFKGLVYLKSVILHSELEDLDMHAFYGCYLSTQDIETKEITYHYNMSIFTDATELPDTWSKRFNSSFLPVFFGAKLSEDGTYVVSWTKDTNTIQNANALGGIGTPLRDGYDFAGWGLEEGATEKVYDINDVSNIPNGTKLFAIWVEAQSEQPND